MTDVEKQLFTSLMKSTTAEVEQAERAFDTARAEYEAANPGHGIVEFCRTEKGRHLYGAQRVAERRRDAGPVEAYTAAIDAAIDKIDQDIEKSIEDFSVAHNLERVEARTRLRKISPSFASLEKARRNADDERGAAVAKARDDAAAWRYRELAKARQEIEDEQRDSLMMPSEKALRDIAKARGTTVAAILDTAEGRALYRAANEERDYRNGHRR